MGTHALRHLLALTLALGVGMLPACATTTVTLGALAEAEDISRDAIVALTNGFAVAARVEGNRVEVVAFRSADEVSWTAEVTATDTAGEMTAHLVAHEGETGDEWNSFFFGTAPPESSRVLVDGLAGRGGQVTDGAWVIAFRQKGVRPDQLSWQVLDAAGAVVDEGTGITP